jgi:REP element-mobilizing transposase RayT
MATHMPRGLGKQIYFVTFTCDKWRPLISESEAYPAFDKWFSILSAKHVQLLGYVIMPNHFHAILGFTDHTTISLNALIANAKRFIAYDIIKNLEHLKKEQLLWELYSDTTVAERKKGKIHTVFKASFDSKILENISDVERVLNYLHNNPCAKKWNLANSPEEYIYSSAQFYLQGEAHNFLVDYRSIT